MKKGFIFILMAALVFGVVFISCSNNPNVSNSGAFKVGNVSYKTLQEAVDAVAGKKDISPENTIVLADDTEDEGASLDAEVEIAVDLNGHVLTAKGDKPVLQLSEKVKGAEIKGGTVKAAKDKTTAGLIKAACPLKVEDTRLDVSEAKDGSVAVKAEGAKADIQLKGETKVSSTEKQNAVDVSDGAKLAIKDEKTEVSGGIKLDDKSEIKAENGKVEILSYEGDGKIETSESAKIEVPEGSDIDTSEITEDIKEDEKPHGDGSVDPADKPEDDPQKPDPENPEKPEDPEKPEPEDPQDPEEPEQDDAEEIQILNHVKMFVDRTANAESRAQGISSNMMVYINELTTDGGFTMSSPFVLMSETAEIDPWYDEATEEYEMGSVHAAVVSKEGVNNGEALEFVSQYSVEMSEGDYEYERFMSIESDSLDPMILTESDDWTQLLVNDVPVATINKEGGLTVIKNDLGITQDVLDLIVAVTNAFDNMNLVDEMYHLSLFLEAYAAIDEMGIVIEDFSFGLENDNGTWNLETVDLSASLCSGAAEYGGHEIDIDLEFEGQLPVNYSIETYGVEPDTLLALALASDDVRISATIDGEPAHFTKETLKKIVSYVAEKFSAIKESASTEE